MLNSEIRFDLTYVDVELRYAMTKVYSKGGLNFDTPITIYFIENGPIHLWMEHNAVAFAVYPYIFLNTTVRYRDTPHFTNMFAHELWHLAEQMVWPNNWVMQYINNELHLPWEKRPSEMRASEWANNHYPLP